MTLVKSLPPDSSMQKQYCEHCGASMKPNKHRLTGSMVQMLGEVYGQVCRSNSYIFEPSKDFRWPPIKYNNFQKLRYFGLIAKTDTKGQWILTSLGASFIKGRAKVIEGRITFRNKLQGSYGEMVDVTEVWKSCPYVERYDYSNAEQIALI